MPAPDLRHVTEPASRNDEAIYRQLVDGIRTFLAINVPRMPLENREGIASLCVSALIATAAGILAEFHPDIRGIALEHAQDYLARSLNAELADQKGKDDGIHRG
jgi:hypothetical protein